MCSRRHPNGERWWISSIFDMARDDQGERGTIKDLNVYSYMNGFIEPAFTLAAMKLFYRLTIYSPCSVRIFCKLCDVIAHFSWPTHFNWIFVGPKPQNCMKSHHMMGWNVSKCKIATLKVTFVSSASRDLFNWRIYRMIRQPLYTTSYRW